MFALFIIGLIFLGMGYPLMKVLERRGSRWSNLVLAACIFIGLLLIGLFAGVE